MQNSKDLSLGVLKDKTNNGEWFQVKISISPIPVGFSHSLQKTIRVKAIRISLKELSRVELAHNLSWRTKETTGWVVEDNAEWRGQC